MFIFSIIYIIFKNEVKKTAPRLTFQRFNYVIFHNFFYHMSIIFYHIEKKNAAVGGKFKFKCPQFSEIARVKMIETS